MDVPQVITEGWVDDKAYERDFVQTRQIGCIVAGCEEEKGRE